MAVAWATLSFNRTFHGMSAHSVMSSPASFVALSHAGSLERQTAHATAFLCRRT